ncbi:rRNA pseudouridine synthase [Candidatus Saccharibacteria bacterium]|nr:rRNA pseudouridine synthase [Candidatus Saccharibacteria bacterium]
MRINKFIAQSTGISRRMADRAIIAGRTSVNGVTAESGTNVAENDMVLLDGRPVLVVKQTVTIVFNKPIGYVVSRDGQGARTIYDILPPEYHLLKPIGRLDKDSSGLLLLTNNGDLANELTHPRYGKTKVYTVRLNKPLEPLHQQMISDYGVTLQDGPSKLSVVRDDDEGPMSYIVTMQEGRNRQIRRTFNSLGYDVKHLQRTQFGNYSLDNLASGQTRIVV